ncbi:MAG: hypothetical protein K2H85_01825, partial [Allobaculum sp.]|nr:hypothetical protein [Allobaculum sp.]
VQSDCNGGWGIIVNEGAPGPNTQVTLTGTTIETPNGLTVKGTMLPDVTTLDDSQVPVITLSNVKFDTKDTGIYQAGLSNITVNNSTISSDSCGIETRAGKLEVNNSTVEGGTDTLDVTSEGNGQTTKNAGIAVAQHTTDKPITVNINGSTVSGGAALAITDPQGQQKQVDGKDDDITITVSNSNLKGEKYPVAYTEDTIEFTLKDTNLNGKEVTKLVDKADGEKSEGNSIFVTDDEGIKEEEINEDNKPFTVNTTSRPTSGGGNKKPTKPVEPEPEEPMTPVATPTTMYRLYNRLTGEHLYTIDKNERDNLLTSDTWKDEGEGWIAPSVSDYPVYRLLNPNNGDHHYTTDKNEFNTLPTYGWVAEGVAFFSADKDNPENVLLHRLYNPNATGAGSHHYTADTNERDTLVEKGWTYEGLAWAGLPANK